VTASQIIEEIERLPSKEKAEVLTALLRSQTAKRQLSSDELVALADQMVATKDPEERQADWKKRFLRAFTAVERCLAFDGNASQSRYGAPDQTSSTTRNFNFATRASRTLAGDRSRSAGGSMVQAIPGDDCLRRRIAG
jgi:hypothetical protein